MLLAGIQYGEQLWCDGMVDNVLAPVRAPWGRIGRLYQSGRAVEGTEGTTSR